MDGLQAHLECGERVGRCLDATEKAVERRDVAADVVDTEDVRLDERGTRPDERVVDALTREEEATEEDLHQLRDVLPEIWVQAVNVLGPLDLRQLRLRPRPFEVDLGVK